jgi:hypothetical protein
VYVCATATAAVQEYNRRFPNLKIPDRKELSNIFITLRQRGTRLSSDVAPELKHLQDEQKLISYVFLDRASS